MGTNMGYIGSYTNTSGGIRVAHTQQFVAERGDRSSAQNIAIILTDGTPNLDLDRTVSDADALAAANTQVYVIGITSAITEDLARDMSSGAETLNENYFLANDFTDLSSIKTSIMDSTAFCPSAGDSGRTTTTDISGDEWCFHTEEEGTICLCTINECDIQPLNGTTCENVKNVRSRTEAASTPAQIQMVHTNVRARLVSP